MNLEFSKSIHFIVSENRSSKIGRSCVFRKQILRQQISLLGSKDRTDLSLELTKNSRMYVYNMNLNVRQLSEAGSLPAKPVAACTYTA